MTLTGKTETRIQRPLTLSPWAQQAGTDNRGTVWISMKPRKILDQFSKGQGTVATTEPQEDFVFLAPLSLNENIVHHWEAYESIASRMAQKARSLVKLGAEGAGLARASMGNNSDLKDDFKNLFSQNAINNVGGSIETFVSRAYKAVPTSSIPKIKVDTPLYYSNSDRRQIVFEFVLFHENLSKRPEDVLIKPIQRLMKLSSPHLKSDINIEFPYMWEIKTIPNEFIKYTTCALIGVQPTWNSPYVQHVPSSVNLQLTFLDMSPLYRDTIEQGSVINVISKTKADAIKAQGNLTKINDYINNIGKTKKAGQAQPEVVQLQRNDGRH